jgi:DNA-binding NarL/FixJ family response regulator
MDVDEDTPAPLRTIVVDDDPLARRVVKDALQQAGITVIAEAGSGREAVELAAYYEPDVVLMDLVMPGMDGLEATRKIHSTRPGVSVVILTASDDEELGVLGLRAGAVGYLNKRVDLMTLPRVVRAVAAGEAAVPRDLTRRIIERFRRTREDAAGMRPVRSVLTSREWEVLDLLCAGATTEEVADDLVLSTETVRSHVKNILRKLKVSSRAEAIAMARKLREEAASAEPRNLVA